jgi:hypothetical protein
MKIRIVLIGEYTYELDNLDEQLKDNLYSFVTSLKEAEFIDFEVTNEIDEENLNYICHGRVFSKLFNDSVDFYSDYYQNWCFKEVNGEWKVI